MTLIKRLTLIEAQRRVIKVVKYAFLTGSSLSLYTRGVVTRFLGEVLTSMPVCC